MLYVFLDIDGVLNVRDDKNKGERDVRMYCVRRLVEALQDFQNVRFVLTSEWRKWFFTPNYCESYLNYLQRYLRRFGMEIWDKTDKIEFATRELEIKEYVRRNKVKNYIILDDERHHYSYDCKNLYLVDPKEGFSLRDQKRLYDKCLELFGDWCFEEEDYEVSSNLQDDWEWDFDVEEEVEDSQEQFDGISFTMKATEQFQDTGRALMSYLSAKSILQMPGVMLSGPEYEVVKIVGLNIIVQPGMFTAFLKGLHNEISMMFPIKNILDIFCFETSDMMSKQAIKVAETEYCAQLSKEQKCFQKE